MFETSEHSAQIKVHVRQTHYEVHYKQNGSSETACCGLQSVFI